jgi:hypothetical protein
MAVIGADYDHLLIMVDPHGVPQGFELDYERVFRQVRHRRREGWAVAVRPAHGLRSPDWSSMIRGHGLRVVEYATAGGLAEARSLSNLEFHLRAMRALCRDNRIDGVMVVCPTFHLEPLAHAVHDAGRSLVVADLEEYLGRSAPLADYVFAIDSFILAVQP